MYILPAIDLRAGQVVRLYQGDYDQMTVYGQDPAAQALAFRQAGASQLHLVDLDGAKDGTTANYESIRSITALGGFSIEVGGGIRTQQRIEDYLTLGVERCILGTVAVEDFDFTARMAKEYGSHIAVGVDARDGYVAIRGWTEQSAWTFEDFCRRLQSLGVSTVISTDISRDGAMMGTNVELYRRLSADYSMDIIASGGVSSLEDVAALKAMGLYGAIIGKAYYTGAIDLRRAIEVAT